VRHVLESNFVRMLFECTTKIQVRIFLELFLFFFARQICVLLFLCFCKSVQVHWGLLFGCQGNLWKSRQLYFSVVRCWSWLTFLIGKDGKITSLCINNWDLLWYTINTTILLFKMDSYKRIRRFKLIVLKP
jgi:hypothetical protein